MKNLFNKMPLMGVILALLFVFTQSAFTSKTMVSYHFIDNKVLTDDDSASNYEPYSSIQSCNTSQQNLPCIVTIDTEKWSNLQDYLDSFSGPSKYENIKDAATVQRAN